MIILAPSILSADFANLESEIKGVISAGAEYIHVDVMDGHFVPNITIGPCVVKSVRKKTDAVLDVHLMIENPDDYIDSFIEAGSDIITVHHESNMDFNKIYKSVKGAGKKLCVSINPETPVHVLDTYSKFVDMFLIMSVHPGFGGQSFIEASIEKIKYLRKKYPNIDIEVDGGIKLENVDKVINAGANVIVAGSAVFSSDDIEKAVSNFINR